MRHLLAGTMLVIGFAAPWSASALPLRSPQVPFQAAPLQDYMNSVDSGINVQTDQLAEIAWWPNQLPASLLFAVRLARSLDPEVSIGIQITPGQTLIEIFPPGAAAGLTAYLGFISGGLTVDTFDASGNQIGSIQHPGVSLGSFNFYARSRCLTSFEQTSLNPSANPQALAYAAHGDYRPTFWLCFETCAYTGSSTFDGIVLLFGADQGDPAIHATWGRVKGMYR